ncbi:L-asparaginase [Alkalihalophilus pseudofirmus OF4]|uniref:asparaginase n=1 Tax=Alkalihalophilus pseudofirmus (strain ATCC BAA-2126 / JCM 17055 / OF4) TaxID=398511 RepID=D3G020_ALKPO|nr:MULTISPECIES: asparaginase [Alkalihalophilus]ADC51105.1 L-asparaginase [Alkalihalophilus pseudofirmus OF4]MED1601476.1 asparaginase [Alkalihalophilus marmarensis]
MKKILVLHTGGTIAMQEDEHGAVTPNLVNPLYSTIESLSSIASVVVDDYLNIPSPHMTPSLMVDLAKRLKERVQNDSLDGIVVTHGTDTLEETAYLLDLVLNIENPVVVTGAMRSSNELGSDGPHNLISAVKTAASDEAYGKGVLVVLNDEIHTAKNVTKTHSSNIATFQSPQYGPIGIVTKRGVNFHHTLSHRECHPVDSLTKKVSLLKTYAGMEADIVEAVADAGINGLVIEAFGQGNVPPAIMPALDRLIKKQIPVVLVSRCYSGVVQDTYGYDGGGRTLKDLGVIFTNGLNGQKARLKLMVALELTTDNEQLQQIFLT